MTEQSIQTLYLQFRLRKICQMTFVRPTSFQNLEQKSLERKKTLNSFDQSDSPGSIELLVDKNWRNFSKKNFFSCWHFFYFCDLKSEALRLFFFQECWWWFKRVQSVKSESFNRLAIMRPSAIFKIFFRWWNSSNSGDFTRGYELHLKDEKPATFVLQRCWQFGTIAH